MRKGDGEKGRGRVVIDSYARCSRFRECAAVYVSLQAPRWASALTADAIDGCDGVSARALKRSRSEAVPHPQQTARRVSSSLQRVAAAFGPVVTVLNHILLRSKHHRALLVDLARTPLATLTDGGAAAPAPALLAAWSLVATATFAAVQGA